MCREMRNHLPVPLYLPVEGDTAQPVGWPLAADIVDMNGPTAPGLMIKNTW